MLPGGDPEGSAYDYQEESYEHELRMGKFNFLFFHHNKKY